MQTMKWYTPLALAYAVSCGGTDTDRAIKLSALEAHCDEYKTCSDDFGIRIADTARCNPLEVEVQMKLGDGIELTYCAMHMGDGVFDSRKYSQK
jgi:hypothetical protein